MGQGCQHAVNEVEWSETGQNGYLGIGESDPEMGAPLSIVGGTLDVRDDAGTIDRGVLDSNGGW